MGAIQAALEAFDDYCVGIENKFRKRAEGKLLYPSATKNENADTER